MGEKKELERTELAPVAPLLEGQVFHEKTELLSFPEVVAKVEQLTAELQEFVLIRAGLINFVEQMNDVEDIAELIVLIRRIPPAAGSDYIASIEALVSQVRLAKAIEVKDDQSELATTLSEQLASVDSLLKFIAGDGAIRQLVEFVTLHETDKGRVIEVLVRRCQHFTRSIQFINDKIDRLSGTAEPTDDEVQERMKLISDFLPIFKRQLAELQKYNLLQEITDAQVDDAFLALRKSSMRVAASKYYEIFETLRQTMRTVFAELAIATQTDKNSMRAHVLRLADAQPNPGTATECMRQLQQFVMGDALAENTAKESDEPSIGTHDS